MLKSKIIQFEDDGSDRSLCAGTWLPIKRRFRYCTFQCHCSKHHCQKFLKNTEDTLKGINEQIHYTGQYLANKDLYSEYRKSRNKENFYEQHRAELTLYESALRILKEKAQGKKLPTLKMLREEKSRLTALQSDQREEFNARREYERELRTVCSNVDIILGTHQPQERQLEQTHEK